MWQCEEEMEEWRAVLLFQDLTLQSFLYFPKNTKTNTTTEGTSGDSNYNHSKLSSILLLILDVC